MCCAVPASVAAVCVCVCVRLTNALWHGRLQIRIEAQPSHTLRVATMRSRPSHDVAAGMGSVSAHGAMGRSHTDPTSQLPPRMSRAPARTLSGDGSELALAARSEVDAPSSLRRGRDAGVVFADTVVEAGASVAGGTSLGMAGTAGATLSDMSSDSDSASDVEVGGPGGSTSGSAAFRRLRQRRMWVRDRYASARVLRAMRVGCTRAPHPCPTPMLCCAVTAVSRARPAARKPACRTTPSASTIQSPTASASG